MWRKQATSAASIAFFIMTLALSAPWYIRNIVFYGTLSGTVEARAGVGVRQVMHSLALVPWTTSIPYMARASLWTGNNSFTTFSRTTLNVWLGMLLVSVYLYCYNIRRYPIRAPEAAIVVMSGLYCLGLGYVTASSFFFTHGAAAGASPWYMQPLLAPVLCLAFLGLARAGVCGRIVAALTAALSVYLISATYLANLVPLYGGYHQPRSQVADLYTWYVQDTNRDTILRYLCLVGPQTLFALIGIVLVLGSALGIYLCWELFRYPPQQLKSRN